MRKWLLVLILLWPAWASAQTCPAGTTPLPWGVTRDGTTDLTRQIFCQDSQGRITATVLSVQNLEKLRFTDAFPGATLGARIVACWTNLPATGGICDARNEEGPQNITANPFAGLTKPLVLLVGDSLITVSADILLPSNTAILGLGQARSIFQRASGSLAGAVVFKNSDTVAGNSYIYLAHLTVDGNKAGQATANQQGIYFDNVSNSTIFDVEAKNVRGGAGAGIAWSSADNTKNKDNAILDCFIHDNGVTIAINGDGIALGGTRVRVIGNTFRDNTDTGVGLQGNTTSHIVISSNTFDATGAVAGTVGVAAGPGVGANNDILVSDNSLRGTNAFGVILQDVNTFQVAHNTINITSGATVAGAIIILNSSDGTVSGNMIVSSSGTGIQVYSDAAATTHNISIVGNTVRNNKLCGIQIDSAAAGATTRDISVTGNIVKNNSQGTANTYDGVFIGATGTTRNITVTGNSSSDDQGGGATQRYGFAGAGALTFLTIAGNIATGNVTGAYGGFPVETRLAANNTGAASSATSQADSIMIGDDVNMPNSSSRELNLWGRDAGGAFRDTRIVTDGVNTWFGQGTPFAAMPTAGFKVDGLTGALSVIAYGSSQDVNITPSGPSGMVKIGSVTFANLGAPGNGCIIYCSDCTIANPCAGAGTGAIAKRLNGLWVCN